MKVLETGLVQSPESWKARVRCIIKKRVPSDPKGCGAKFEAETKDLRHFWWHGTHFRHDYVGVECPLCGKITSVKRVPKSIQDKVLKDKGAFDGFSEEI